MTVPFPWRAKLLAIQVNGAALPSVAVPSFQRQGAQHDLGVFGFPSDGPPGIDKESRCSSALIVDRLRNEMCKFSGSSRDKVTRISEVARLKVLNSRIDVGGAGGGRRISQD